MFLVFIFPWISRPLKTENSSWGHTPYFFGYKTVFSYQNNPKNLDPSYKTDLDLQNCFGRVKHVL